MAKADPIAAEKIERHVDERRDPEKDATDFFSNVALMALPMPLFRKLSDEAAKRNMRLPELLTVAVAEYINRTEK